MKTTKVKAIDLDLTIPKDMLECTQDVFGGLPAEPEYSLRGFNLRTGVENLKVLDIGFCFGLFSMYAMKTWPGCTVVAFEPDANLCKLGVKNITKNKEKLKGAITIFNKAVSDSSGLVTYHPGGSNAGCGTITPEKTPGVVRKEEDAVEVEVIDADMMSNKFHIIKVDTEGSEVPILSRMVLDETAVVIYEYHNPEDRIELERIMQDKGFVLLKCKSHSMYVGVCAWLNKKAITHG